MTAACGRRRVPPPPQRRDPSPAVQHSVRLQQSPGHARSLRLYAWPCGRAVSVAWCGSQARLCARFGRLWALICELLGSFVRMQILLPQSGLRRPVPRRGGSPQQRLPGRPPRSGGPLADAEHTGSAPPPVQGSPTRLCVFARAAAKGLHANTQRGGSLANAEQTGLLRIAVAGVSRAQRTRASHRGSRTQAPRMFRPAFSDRRALLFTNFIAMNEAEKAAGLNLCNAFTRRESAVLTRTRPLGL